MIRTILAIATAPLAAMTLFASAAEACISCEYVPEVARSSSTSHESKTYARSRAYKAAEERRARTSKKRYVKTDDGSSKAGKAEKTEKATKKVETAKAAPVEAQTEHSSMAGSDTKKVESATTAPETSGQQTENSTISTAAVGKSEPADAKQSASEEPQVSTNVGCKKFFPTVGMTLSVPCE